MPSNLDRCFAAAWLLAGLTVNVSAQDEPIRHPATPPATSRPAPAPRHVAPASAAALLVIPNLECTLTVDGVDRGRVSADHSIRVPAELGDHVVLALSLDRKDRLEVSITLDKPGQKLLKLDLANVREAREAREPRSVPPPSRSAPAPAPSRPAPAAAPAPSRSAPTAAPAPLGTLRPGSWYLWSIGLQGPQRVGLINLEQVVLASPEGQQTVQTIQKRFGPLKQQIQAESDDVDNRKKYLQSLPANTPEDQRASLLQGIDAAEKRLQADAKNAEGQYEKDFKAALAAVAARVAPCAQQFAQSAGYTMLLDVGVQDSVLYADDSTNLSQSVLDAYKAGRCDTARRDPPVARIAVVRYETLVLATTEGRTLSAKWNAATDEATKGDVNASFKKLSERVSPALDERAKAEGYTLLLNTQKPIVVPRGAPDLTSGAHDFTGFAAEFH